MNGEVKVHLERDGRPYCGQHLARAVTSDLEQVTCGRCGSLLSGAYGTSQWADVKPCGTLAAYRRHLRRGGKPVRCESCLAALRRHNQDRRAAEKDKDNARRREQYAAARAAGMSVRQANRRKDTQRRAA